MKLGVIDSINEEEVVSSFICSARLHGWQVIETGRFRKNSKEEFDVQFATAWKKIEKLVEAGVDAVFNFRAIALSAEMVDWLNSKGVFTIIWLPDDPVFFQDHYKDLVPHYSLVLNCGNKRVSKFYESELGVKGWNFPFWAGPDSYTEYDDCSRDHVLFLGNVTRGVRHRRAEILSSLDVPFVQYGRNNVNEKFSSAGWLSSPQEISTAAKTARLGLNIPQIFSDYVNTDMGFPELAQLGSFQVPSRLVQYAACGLPVISLELFEELDFPGCISVDNPESVPAAVRDLFHDAERLNTLSTQIRRHFLAAYTSDKRIMFLDWLLNSADRNESCSRIRSTKFADF